MELAGHGNRTGGVSERCEYYTHGGARRCPEPSAGELRAGRMLTPGDVPWGMCAGHVKPEHHPADLHKHLYRW